MKHLWLLALALASPTALAHTMSAADDDGDLVADEIESTMCGRRIIREYALDWLHPFAGECADPDYSAPDASGLEDRDGDGIPEGIEDVLCGIEDQNDEQDGFCSGDDYSGANLTP